MPVRGTDKSGSQYTLLVMVKVATNGRKVGSRNTGKKKKKDNAGAHDYHKVGLEVKERSCEGAALAAFFG